MFVERGVQTLIQNRITIVVINIKFVVITDEVICTTIHITN